MANHGDPYPAEWLGVPDWVRKRMGANYGYCAEPEEEKSLGQEINERRVQREDAQARYEMRKTSSGHYERIKIK